MRRARALGAALAAATGMLGAVWTAPAATAADPAQPAAAPAPALAASPSPCSPHAGACTAAPGQLAVTFPAGVPAGVDAVQLAWTTTGRPVGAPGPAQTSAVLTTASGGCATPAGQSATTCSWPWPGGLEAAGVVLNGTYQVTACSTPPGGGACSPASSPGPSSFGVGVAPLPPGSVAAHATGTAPDAAVSVSWATGTAPDLAGYRVARAGTVVFTCTLHGATSPGAGACPADPSFTDRAPGNGTASYQVTAYRFGPQGDLAAALASAPATATVALPAAGASAPLAPAPTLGAAATPTVTLPAAAPGAAPVTPAPPTTANTYGALPFGTAPPAERAAAVPLEPGSSSHGVGGIALVAAALLLLAVAAHLLYLRDRVARYQAAHGGAAPDPAAVTEPAGVPAVPAPPRPRRRVQWGAWPPIRRVP
jgi:hypothetical protein